MSFDHYCRSFLKGFLYPLLVINLQAYASDSNAIPEIKTFYSFTERSGQDLKSFLEKSVGIPADVLSRRGYYKKISKWNPHINNPQSLEKGTRVYIEVPFKTQLSPVVVQRPVPQEVEKVAPIAKSTMKKPQETAPKNDAIASRLKLRPYYSFLGGNFEEVDSTREASISSSQNSPLTLGLNAKFQNREQRYWLADIELLKLSRGEVANSNADLDLPWEYSISGFYGLENFYNLPFSIISGLSLDKLSSYDIGDTAEETNIVENTIVFAALGAEKKLQIFDQAVQGQLYAGLSLISSSSTPSSDSEEEPESFSGLKVGGHLELQSTWPWTYHVQLDMYSLSGPTDLTITRYGVGVGYIF